MRTICSRPLLQWRYRQALALSSTRPCWVVRSRWPGPGGSGWPLAGVMLHGSLFAHELSSIALLDRYPLLGEHGDAGRMFNPGGMSQPLKRWLRLNGRAASRC